MRRRNGLPKFLGMAKSPNPKVKRPTRSLGVVGAVSIAGDNGGAGGPPMSATRQVSVKQTAAPAAPAAAAAPRGRRRLPAAVEAIAGDPVAPAPAAAGHRPPLKLLARLRHAFRVRHYSIRTEQSYVDWVRRFILFHGKRHPADLGRSRCRHSSTHLAVDRSWLRRRRTRPVGAVVPVPRGTRSSAAVARRHRRRQAIAPPAGGADAVGGARPAGPLSGTMGLVGALLYGTGMRLLEALAPAHQGRGVRAPGAHRPRRQGRQGSRHRVAGEPGVAAAHAHRPRATAAPARPCRRPAATCGCPTRWRSNTATPRASGAGSGCSPRHPLASIRARRAERRHHLNETRCRRPCRSRRVAPASSSLVRRTRCATRSQRTCCKPVTTSARCRSLLGHSDVKTTMIYTHVLNRGGRGVRSPLDTI